MRFSVSHSKVWSVSLCFIFVNTYVARKYRHVELDFVNESSLFALWEWKAVMQSRACQFASFLRRLLNCLISRLFYTIRRLQLLITERYIKKLELHSRDFLIFESKWEKRLPTIYALVSMILIKMNASQCADAERWLIPSIRDSFEPNSICFAKCERRNKWIFRWGSTGERFLFV